MVLHASKSRIFQLEPAEGTGNPGMLTCVAKVSNPKVSDHMCLKILPHKEMLQRLPIALAQVNSGNTSKKLLNEIIFQIIFFFYQGK